MSDLQPLRADHGSAVLAFELANRAYFAASVTDRGDDYFLRFAEQHRTALAEQATGRCAFYVLLDDDDGVLLGRFNLYDIVAGTATVGYRVAQHAAGRGVASAAVRQLCRAAARDHGVRRLGAAAAAENAASARVLVKAGFVPVGPADPAEVGGRAGTRYERDLTDEGVVPPRPDE